jgi:hypothetical protein
MEGRRSSGTASALLNASAQGELPSLAGLEGSWMGLGGGEASFAYAWSLAVVESIIQTSGTGDITRLLDDISSAPNTEQALRDALHEDYADLQQQALTYLHQQDVR